MDASKRAASQWDRAQSAYDYYAGFISSKSDRYALSVVDLVFVRNFKGGSTIVCEPEASLKSKIQLYENDLRDFAKKWANFPSLGKVSEASYGGLRDDIVAYVSLPMRNRYHIKGFAHSFVSALLHFHFPNLVPILDKRALNGCGIQGLKVGYGGNVTNMVELYPHLIDEFRSKLVADPSASLRSIDRGFFVQKLRVPPFAKTTRKSSEKEKR